MPNDDIVIKHFEGKPVRFRSDDGKLTLTMKEAGELFGYDHPREAVGHLYSTHKDEFDNDCTLISISDTPVSVHLPPIRERVFTIEGLLLLSMFCELPTGKRVRHWLRKIGKQVLVEGYTTSPALTKILDGFNETLLMTGKMVQNLAERLQTVEAKFNSVYVPAPADNSFWPTPTQYARKLRLGPKFPPRFNGGGSFDWWVSQRHAELRGGHLSQRDRRYLRKRPDFVIEECPENADFIRDCFKVYLAHERPDQPKLKLVPEKTAKGR